MRSHEAEPRGPGQKTQRYASLRCGPGTCQSQDLELIGEEPLLIRIADQPYAVVMRTPGDEIFHAAGFCLSEGLADEPNDFTTIGYCQDLDPNVIDVRLTPAQQAAVQELLQRRGFVSQTSCGICGKELIKDLCQRLTPVRSEFEITIERVFECIEQLSENQNYYQRTRGSHAALIFDDQLEVIAFAEDVGRHNALDKAIGKAFMNRCLDRASLLVLSSRISYELVQKAARAQLPIMISNSRPTALAVEMGKALDMTLAFPAAKKELIVVCGDMRIVGK
jgi:FdhD protein